MPGTFEDESLNPSPLTQIVNLVATSRVNQRIDLRKLGRIPSCTYNDRMYHGNVAYVKTPEMAGKVSVFGSGRMISVGTRSETAARSDLAVTCKLLKKAGLIKTKSEDMRVRNVVALVTFPWKLDLELLAREQSHAIYEPEQFPGAIVRFEAYPEITVLAFSSGKLIIAGARSVPSVKKIAGDLCHRLKGRSS